MRKHNLNAIHELARLAAVALASHLEVRRQGRAIEARDRSRPATLWRAEDGELGDPVGVSEYWDAASIEYKHLMRVDSVIFGDIIFNSARLALDGLPLGDGRILRAQVRIGCGCVSCHWVIDGNEVGDIDIEDMHHLMFGDWGPVVDRLHLATSIHQG